MKTRRFSVTVDGQPIDVVADVRDAGNELLFLIHGLGCSRESFHHIWRRKEFNHYSVLAPDLVGFGASSSPDGFSYAMEAQAAVCAEILREYSDRNLHIVAHSMGGAVALLLPARVLNGAKTFSSVEGNLTGADCGIMSRRITTVPLTVFEEDLFPELRDMFNRLGKGYAAMDATSACALYRSAESLVAWSDSNALLEIFQALTLPKAYFYGDENAFHPTAGCVGNVHKVMIKGSGHFPMLDNPDAFYGKLHRFVAASVTG